MGQERCEKFMQQDLTLLLPSVIHPISTESQKSPLPPNTTTNKASVIATLIQTVEPVIGFTSKEVQQIQTIQDILGTTACEGYVNTNS